VAWGAAATLGTFHQPITQRRGRFDGGVGGVVGSFKVASFPRGIRLTSIYSQRDPICPPSSCRLEVGQGAHLKNVEVAQGGHLAFLFHASISSIICRELESAEPPSAIGSRFVRAASSHRAMAAKGHERIPSAASAA
jgi:hypothetical protein